MKATTWLLLAAAAAGAWYLYDNQNTYTDSHGRTWTLTQDSTGWTATTFGPAGPSGPSATPAHLIVGGATKQVAQAHADQAWG